MKSTTGFDEITVFGAHGHSLMILRGLEEQWRGKVRIRALIDDIENGFMHPRLGIPVISSEKRLTDHADLPVLMTVANPSTLRRLVAQLDEAGLRSRRRFSRTSRMSILMSIMARGLW